MSKSKILGLLNFSLIILLISGCNQSNFLSSSYSSAFNILTNQFSQQKDVINRDLIETIPYASSAISLGSNKKSLIILESVTNKKNKWISADKIKLYEEKGRILRSIGLPNDLHSIERPKLDFKMIIDKGYVSYVAYYSFRNPEMNNLRVEVKSTVIGPESIAIFGLKKELILIEERIYSPLIHWSAKNKFWYDPENDYVWKSKQYLTPKLPAIDIEVTKKPAI
jgi:hypothetical protein